MMNSLLKAFYRLSGTTYDVIRHNSPDTRTRYNSLACALLLTTGVAIFGGIEIASQFTKLIEVKIAAGIFWGLAIFIFDFFLLNGNAKGIQKYIRITVGLASVMITISALFITLNQSTIDKIIDRQKSDKILKLDSEYFASKDARYSEVNKNKKLIAEYHQKNCISEALNGYPGIRYTQKHSLCEQTNHEIELEMLRLNDLEKPFIDGYSSEVKRINGENSNDYFAKLRLLPGVLNQNFTSQIIAICVFIVFCYIEIQSILLKFGIKKDDEYHISLNAYLENKKNIAIERINQEYLLEKSKYLQDDTKSHIQRQKEQIVLDLASIEIIANKEKAVRTILKICEKNGYNESCSELEKMLQGTKGKSETEPDKQDIFEMSQPMKEIVETIKICSTNKTLCENIFNWIVKNIDYDTEHSKQHYRTAMQTYDEKLGLCGELSVLYMSMLRAVNIDCNYCTVTKDINEKPVTHACVIIDNDDGSSTLSDVAYKAFQINHSEYRAISDEELMVKYDSWNQR